MTVGRLPKAGISRCSFTITGARPHTQQWYNCRTCWGPRTDIGVCTICSQQCHAGHQVQVADVSPFFCDCGAGPSCKCLL